MHRYEQAVEPALLLQLISVISPLDLCRVQFQLLVSVLHFEQGGLRSEVRFLLKHKAVFCALFLPAHGSVGLPQNEQGNNKPDQVGPYA